MKTQNKADLMAVEKGKLPPQATDIEEAVLGAVMASNEAIHIAVEILKPEVFYKDAHKNIFQAMYNLYNCNSPIDLLTVSAELKKQNKLTESGGDLYLIQLTQKVSSSAHLEYHSRIVLQKYIQRQCIEFSSDTINKSYDDDFDVFELLEKVYNNFGSINDLITAGTTFNFEDEVLNFLKIAEQQKDGIKSNIQAFNRVTGGFFKTDLIILAGRPGMGKTAYALNDLLYMAFNGYKVFFSSLEMGRSQIIGRLLSIISGIDSSLLRQTSKLSSGQRSFLIKCCDILAKLPIHIDDTSGLSPIELKLKVSKVKREKGVDILFVDYLQLMKVKDRKVNREQEISIISGSLKSIAKELDMPVIALSQLSRSVEQRGGSKRPLLSDLRDSGSIEQDADMVLFIYRPEYYKIEEWDDEERGSTLGQSEIDVAKFRNGETGYIRNGCNLACMRFYDIDASFDEINNRYVKTYDSVNEEKEEIKLPKLNPFEAFGEEKDDFLF